MLEPRTAKACRQFGRIDHANDATITVLLAASVEFVETNIAVDAPKDAECATLVVNMLAANGHEQVGVAGGDQHAHRDH